MNGYSIVERSVYEIWKEEEALKGAQIERRLFVFDTFHEATKKLRELEMVEYSNAKEAYDA